MECVPNFSEGRDLAKIEKIVDKFRAKAGVKLLDYSNDEDHRSGREGGRSLSSTGFPVFVLMFRRPPRELGGDPQR